MKNHVIYYEGWLYLKTLFGDEDQEVLTLSSLDEPLAEELNWMCDKKVTVRYWLTDEPISRERADEIHSNILFGSMDAGVTSVYTECTGYLWTDEDLKVGGHDLLKIFKSAIGKFLILEVEVH
jgi:hypothetical protein